MYHKIQTQSAIYQFMLHPADSKFYRVSGIYIFIIIPESLNQEQITIDQYSLLYVGITNNFQARLSQHHKIKQAISLGMTHIGILKISSGRKRKKIERDILKCLNPALNQTWVFDKF